MHVKLTPSEIDMAIQAWLRQQGLVSRGPVKFVVTSFWNPQLTHAVVQVERPDTPEPIQGPFRDKPV